jgi:WS/DGAT/MGAT family acyltransferase
MPLITQLSREDVMFVAGETDTIYQHVALLATLDVSARPDFDFEHFRQHCMERVALIPHLRWKLHSVPLGLDRPYWVEDEHFSFDHHIKHIALPSPGDKDSLCEVATHLYCKHLDRSRPLWETWLIEGLEDGKFAYLQKFHHCMMDGEGAFKMIQIICDFEPEPQQPKEVEKSIREAKAGKVPSYTQRSSKAWQHLARLPGEAARNAVDILRPKILEQFVWPRKPKAERPIVPTACFNGPISSDRGMTFASLPMAELKTVKEHFGVSLNDVVLALVSGAIRDYLLTHAELPVDALRTNIPVSLRTSGDKQLSNKVTNTTVTLATNLDDPVARLRAINEESEQAKAIAHSGAPGMIELFQIMPPIMVSTLMDSLPDDQAPQMLGANLIVSNVRGSPLPMYIAGARIESMYAMSILTAGMGINFTCVSYTDSIDFGVVVEPDLVANWEALATGLEQTLALYMALATAKPKPKQRTPLKSAHPKKAAARKKAPAKKKGAAKVAAKNSSSGRKRS